MLFPCAASLIAQQGPNPGNILLLGLLVVGLLIVVAFIGLFAAFFRWWIQSVLTGAGIGLLDLLGMTFRKVKPAVIVRGMIMARQANIQDPELKSDALEAHYLARGNVPLVIRALIAANKAKTISLTFREATAIDLAGRNVLEAVQTSVYPRVIDCPAKDDARKSLDAVAKDGIQLKVRARVTVRANLQQLIGGAAEETIMARVGEGIVSSIGSSESHKKVLENPDMISKNVLARPLDSQTAFEIVSNDIADIDVGSNIGARFRAEGRRANAIASEQENVATIEESRDKLVDAESEVPRAISEAFRTGKLGVLEYYKLRNLQADTEMRKSISNVGNQSPSPAT